MRGGASSREQLQTHTLHPPPPPPHHRSAGPLQLQRPLVTLDIEATGLNVSRDRVLEIAAIKLMPDGTVRLHAVAAAATL